MPNWNWHLQRRIRRNIHQIDNSMHSVHWDRMINRFWVQAISTFLTNSYLSGFLRGSIYKGPTKHFCVPTLNCYSCPGALFACPVGAAQAIISSGGGLDPTAFHSIMERLKVIFSGTPFFVIGFLTIVGSLVGRATCGWLCPFGWFQEILHKIPSPKFSLPRIMQYLKYVLLLVFVILLPIYWVDQYGYSEPYYCKLICPVGTLQGGFVLPVLQKTLRDQLGRLFIWKTVLFFGFAALMIFFRRPFCATGCPLGAFFAPFNKVCIWKLEFDVGRCINCGLCEKNCPAGVKPPNDIDSLDCVRCAKCVQVCPKDALNYSGPGFSKTSGVNFDPDRVDSSSDPKSVS